MTSRTKRAAEPATIAPVAIARAGPTNEASSPDWAAPIGATPVSAWP